MEQRLTDAEIDAVLRGELPPGRDDLAPMVDAVAAARGSVSAPAPSPELAAFLGSDIPVGAAVPVSNAAATAVHQQVTAPQGKEGVAPRKRVRMFLEWLAGLGLAAKAALGTSVAVASIGTAGLAGALPESAQDAFDRSVPGVTEVDEVERDEAEGDGAEDAERGGVDREDSPAVDPAEAPSVPDNASEQGQQRGEDAREQAPEQGQQQGQQRGEDAREQAPQQPTESEDGRARAPEGAGSAPEEQPTRP